MDKKLPYSKLKSYSGSREDRRRDGDGERRRGRPRKRPYSSPVDTNRSRPSTVPSSQASVVKTTPNFFGNVKGLAKPELSKSSTTAMGSSFKSKQQLQGFRSSSTSTTTSFSAKMASNASPTSSTMSKNSAASAAFAPFLKKYSSPRPSLNHKVGDVSGGGSPSWAKGGVWKRIGGTPIQHNTLAPKIHPPPPPADVGMISKFKEFRRKWEANMNHDKKSSNSKLNPAGSNDNLSPQDGTEKVLRAGSGGLGFGNIMDNVGMSPLVSASLGGKDTTLASAVMKIEPEFIKMEVSDARRIAMLKESTAARTGLRDSAAASQTYLKSKLKLVSKRPLLPIPRGQPHRMPMSWKISQEQATISKSRPYQPKTFEKFLETSAATVFQPQSCLSSGFASPLDLQYPFPGSFIPQLHKLAWDSKQQSGSSFGCFAETASILNPILPILPRLKKPETIDVVMVQTESLTSRMTTGISNGRNFKFLDKSSVTVSTLKGPEIDNSWETPLSLQLFSTNSVNNPAAEFQDESEDSDNDEDDWS